MGGFLAVLLALGTTLLSLGAKAEPKLEAVALPTRSSAFPTVLSRVRRLVQLATPGGEKEEPAVDLSGLVARAGEMSSTGKLDEAAVVLDAVIAEGMGALHQLKPPGVLADAHVERATIALARREVALAETLIERLLRWDPAFELGEGKVTPRMSAAVEGVRQRIGAHPAVRGIDLMPACTGRRLVVGRQLGELTEVTLFVDCRPVATTTLRGDPDGATAAALGLSGARPTWEVVSPPDPHASQPDRPSFWKRAGRWIVLGSAAALVAGVTATGLALGLHEDRWSVSPHL